MSSGAVFEHGVIQRSDGAVICHVHPVAMRVAAEALVSAGLTMASVCESCKAGLPAAFGVRRVDDGCTLRFIEADTERVLLTVASDG